MKKHPAPISWCLGTCAALLYLCFHSTFYNFDGVACAIAVELGDLRHLAHGNHLAYGLLGWAWTGAWRLLGFTGPALLCLQVLDSLLGGLAAGLFCRFLLRRLRLSPAAAVSASSASRLSTTMSLKARSLIWLRRRSGSRRSHSGLCMAAARRSAQTRPAAKRSPAGSSSRNVAGQQNTSSREPEKVWKGGGRDI